MSHARVPWFSAFVVAAAFAALFPLSASASEAGAQAGPASEGEALLQQTIGRYCAACHNDRLQTAGLVLTGLDLSEVGAHAETWEKVVTKLRTRTMPPVGRPRPAADTYDVLAGWLETEIDRVAAARPNPGRTEAFHRLNRAEYANAIRDLLSLDIDVAELLPADDIDEYGFDNMADILTVSPALMERYLSAARKIGRLAVGETPLGPATETYDVPILLMQDDRMGDDVPFGSRGGIGIRHYFPVDGEYDVEIRLHRNYVNYVRGMGSRHELEVRLDGVLVRSFVFGGEEPEGIQAPASYGGNQFGDPEWEEYMLYADANMRARFQATAGPHVVSVAFVRRFTEPEGVLQPRQSIFAVAVNEMRDGNAAVEHVAIGGPYVSTGPGDTPAREALFTCRPESASTADEEACAEEILSSLARRAYRRPLEAGDVATLMDFYRAGRDGGSFDVGVQLALERVLISPDFLFRVERDPIDARPGTSYALNDTELASRLSYFLWSSGPDDALLDLAAQGRLGDPEILAQQARRMLADPRSNELVRNFAGQWLYLRNLRGVVPDAVVFPEFDENLRDAFLQETELFVESLIREDRSVLDLLGADYTYVNEELAGTLYGMQGVRGEHMRRVALDDPNRGGVLGQPSILALTSNYKDTSPVKRGHYVLDVLLGTPPPPPPPGAGVLSEELGDLRALSFREKLEMHSSNPTCSACHSRIDPIGFSLENFDYFGRWRDTYHFRERVETEEEADEIRVVEDTNVFTEKRFYRNTHTPIRAAGSLPSGTAFDGPAGLKRTLLDERHDDLVRQTASKMLAYALGRQLEYYDEPAVRAIIAALEVDGYRFQTLVQEIVASYPFQYKKNRVEETD
jgi:mono/diheme cytochrome c family protein